MAQDAYTLKNILSQKDPSGRLATIAEVLTESNPIIDHLPWVQGNLEIGNRITRRKSLGTPTWRRYNQAVEPSITTTGQVDEMTAQMQDWDEVDRDLAETSGDVAGFQMRNATGKLEAMSQEFATTLIYGNRKTDPDTFTGLIPRASQLNTTYGNGAPVVLDAGGTSSSANASILLVGWSPNKVYGIYPKYSKAGLSFENKGKVTKETDDGLLDVYRSKYSWDCGLCVEDYRYIIRIANIDVDSLSTIGTDSDTSADLYNLVMKALGYLPNSASANYHLYAPRTVWTALNQKAAATGNRAANTDITNARMVSNIFGLPFSMLDCMVETEDVVD